MTRGIVLGKFFPLHKGHIFLIESASKKVDELILLIGSLKSEIIPGNLRYEWLKKTFPNLKIYHIEDENPQYPEENPDFWNIWRNSIRKFVPEKIDYVFTSEDYGDPLAKILNANHICIDKERSKVPISATLIRKNPHKYWEFISDAAKSYFVKKIVLYGPESTGKTTLSKQLAEYFNTIWIPEFARVYLEEKNSPVEESDIPIIAKGQIELEDKAIQKANKFLFCDTDVLVTKVYSEHYYGNCPSWIKEIAYNRQYELYLLTNNDIPHVADSLRDRADRREEMFSLFETELILSKKPFKRITGDFSSRFKQAVKTIEVIINNE
jgi:NadR type nicotinamide-nucleotide adenylyltransferase